VYNYFQRNENNLENKMKSQIEMTKEEFIIAYSSLSINRMVQSALFISDRRAACDYAKHVYNIHPQGMWKKVIADSKRCLSECDRMGVSIDTPLVLKDDECYYGAHGNGCYPLVGK
jgi:hypothetical protein